MRDGLTAVLLITGTILFVSAGIGILRFPSPYARLHAAGKASTLGVVCLVLAAALQLEEGRYATALILVALFQMATSPINAHVVARAAHHRRVPLADPDAVNEWNDDRDE